MPELNYCLNIVKNYAGGYTTTDATSYERGKTKITASEQSTKNKDEKRKNSKKGNTKKEDERRFSIFYRLVEAKGAPIILRLYIITYLKILKLNIFKYYKITPFCAA